MMAAHRLMICLYWVSVVTAQVQSEYECLCYSLPKLREPGSNQPQLLDRLELIEKQMYNLIRRNKANMVCKGGWIGNESSCYIFEKMQTLPWENASLHCHLVRVDSLQEHNFIKDQLSMLNSYRFWTDGNDIESEGTWVWGNATDGFNVSYWDPREPNNMGGRENCLAYFYSNFYTNTWNDLPCDESLTFICEIEDPNIPASGTCD